MNGCEKFFLSSNCKPGVYNLLKYEMNMSKYFFTNTFFPLYIYIYIYTGWNDKIVSLKKTTLQVYFKTFIEKINSANLIM